MAESRDSTPSDYAVALDELPARLVFSGGNPSFGAMFLVIGLGAFGISGIGFLGTVNRSGLGPLTLLWLIPVAAGLILLAVGVPYLFRRDVLVVASDGVTRERHGLRGAGTSWRAPIESYEGVVLRHEAPGAEAASDAAGTWLVWLEHPERDKSIVLFEGDDRERALAYLERAASALGVEQRRPEEDEAGERT